MNQNGSLGRRVISGHRKKGQELSLGYVNVDREGRICIWRFPADVLFGKSVFYHLRQLCFHFESER